jgi:uncharacterized protein YdeI (BOF family)
MRSISMKKLIVFAAVMLLVCGGLFAQADQGSYEDNFARGSYQGPVHQTTPIVDLINAYQNEWVIVEGYLVQQRVPGTYILADDAQNPEASVVVHINPYFWANLEVDAETAVLVYGIVNKSELRIEIEATRVEIVQ